MPKTIHLLFQVTDANVAKNNVMALATAREIQTLSEILEQWAHIVMVQCKIVLLQVRMCSLCYVRTGIYLREYKIYDVCLRVASMCALYKQKLCHRTVKIYTHTCADRQW